MTESATTTRFAGRPEEPFDAPPPQTARIPGLRRPWKENSGCFFFRSSVAFSVGAPRLLSRRSPSPAKVSTQVTDAASPHPSRGRGNPPTSRPLRVTLILSSAYVLAPLMCAPSRCPGATPHWWVTLVIPSLKLLGLPQFSGKNNSDSLLGTRTRLGHNPWEVIVTA